MQWKLVGNNNVVIKTKIIVEKEIVWVFVSSRGNAFMKYYLMKRKFKPRKTKKINKDFCVNWAAQPFKFNFLN